MEELQIHKSLVEFILKLTKKRELNPTIIDGDGNLIRRINTIYRDCLKYYSSINLFKKLTYLIVSDYYNLDQLTHDDKENLYSFLQKVIDDKDMRLKLMSGNPESEFFSVLKTIMPLYIEFSAAIKEKRHYDITTTYERIYNLLDSEALSPYTGKELEEECRKRFDLPLNDVETYKLRMQMKKYPLLKELDIEDPINRGFYSLTCQLLFNLFHRIMIKQYHKYGNYFTQISQDLKLFQFGSVRIIEYRYADSIDISLNGYSWNKFEFWALLGNNKSATPKVDSQKIREYIGHNGHNGVVLVVPEGCKEEALISYWLHDLTEKVITPKELCKKLGIPEEYLMCHDLKTYDYRTFFIDPRDIDRIRIRDLENYPTLKKLISLEEDMRPQYYKKLYATYKGQHPEQEEDDWGKMSPRERRAANPKAWC